MHQAPLTEKWDAENGIMPKQVDGQPWKGSAETSWFQLIKNGQNGKVKSRGAISIGAKRSHRRNPDDTSRAPWEPSFTSTYHILKNSQEIRKFIEQCRTNVNDICKPQPQIKMTLKHAKIQSIPPKKITVQNEPSSRCHEGGTQKYMAPCPRAIWRLP